MPTNINTFINKTIKFTYFFATLVFMEAAETQATEEVKAEVKTEAKTEVTGAEKQAPEVVDIDNYYSDEIQSETLAKHRSVIKNPFAKKEEGKTGFRIMSRKQKQSEPLREGEAKPTEVSNGGAAKITQVKGSNKDVADLLINGIDYLSDKVCEWVTDYRFEDNAELKGKRQAISESLQRLFDKWGVQFEEEFILLVTVAIYASAKSRHMVKKSTTKDYRSRVEATETKVMSLSEAVAEQNKKPKRESLATVS
jgi:hypothetical protein